MTDETDEIKAARAAAEQAAAEALAANPLTDEERAELERAYKQRAETNEKLREELLDGLMQLNAQQLAAFDPPVLQHWLAILQSGVNREYQPPPPGTDREVARALFELGANPPPSDEDDAEDLSPLQSMSDALAPLDLVLEDHSRTVPPFIGVPSAATVTGFIDALLSGDEALSLKVVQRHCDASFSAALKMRQRFEQPLEPGESARERGESAANAARVSVVIGALYYARFYAAVAHLLANAELRVAEEAAEGNTRAQA